MDQVKLVLWRGHRAEIIAIFLFSAAYWTSSLFLASQKLLWYDEFFPYYLSQLPGISHIWLALQSGVDPNPPLSYFVTHAVFGVFGVGPVAARLPSMIGFWITSVGLYIYVRNTAGFSAALLAMAFPSATLGYLYALDAKPYGLLTAWSVIALLFWQKAADCRRRFWVLAGLGLSLAAAVSTHYYGALLLAALVIAWCVRSRLSKTVDVPLIISIVAGLLPLVFFFPLFEGAEAYAGHFWTSRYPSGVGRSYLTLLGPGLLVVAWTVILAFASSVPPTPRGNSNAEPRSIFTIPDMVLAVCLVLLPAAMATFGFFFNVPFTPRYSIVAVLGFGICVAQLARRQRMGTPGIAIGLVLVVVASTLMIYLWDGQNVVARPGDSPLFLRQVSFQATLAQYADTELPIVVADPNSFLMLHHYGGSHIRARIHYLADVDRAVSYIGTDTMERNLIALRRFVPLPVEKYDAFIQRYRRFWICGYEGSGFEWLPEQLATDGAVFGPNVERLGKGNGYVRQVRLD